MAAARCAAAAAAVVLARGRRLRDRRDQHGTATTAPTAPSLPAARRPARRHRVGRERRAGADDPPTTGTPSPIEGNVYVYFVHDDGRGCGSTASSAAPPAAEGTIGSRRSMLSEPPLDPDYSSPWPASTTSSTARARGDTATVDLSDFPSVGADGRDGGRAAARLHRDGQRQGGHEGAAAGRRRGTGVRPRRLVEAGRAAAPMADVQGWHLAARPDRGHRRCPSPVQFTGYGSAFEGTISWEVLQGVTDGPKVAERHRPRVAERRVRRVRRLRRLDPGTYECGPSSASAEDGSPIQRRHQDLHRPVAAVTASGPGRGPSSTASAAAPAVEVRSTVGPSRYGLAPASVKAASSSGLSRPRADHHDDHRPRPGSASVGQRLDRLLVQHARRRRPPRSSGDHVAGRSRARSPPGTARGATACRPPAPSTPAPATSRRAPRPPGDAAGRRPGHHLVDADLGHRLDGQLAAVALGERLHDHQPRRAAPARRRGAARRRSTASWPTRRDHARRRAAPAPSDEHRRASTRARSRPHACAGVTAPSAPVEAPDTGRSASTPPLTVVGPTRRQTGRGVTASALVERVAQPGEEALLLPVHLAESGRSSPRSAASSRSSSSCSASSRVGVATSTCTMQVAAAGARRCVTPRAAQRQHLRRTACPAGRRPCSAPSSVSSVTVVPSAAAVIGTATVQCRSSPSPGEDRVRPLDDLDVEVAGRAAAGADLALAGELDAGAVSTPAGIFDRDRAAGADPAVAASTPGTGSGSPCRSRWQAGARPGGHDLAEERRGAPAGPRRGPRQMSQVRGEVPGAAPAPGRSGRPRRCRPGARGSRRTRPRRGRASSRISASWPRRGRGCAARGRRRRPPPKKASMMSPNAEARAEAAAGAARTAGRRRGRTICALLRVGEHLVGAGDLLEPLLGPRRRG